MKLQRKKKHGRMVFLGILFFLSGNLYLFGQFSPEPHFNIRFFDRRVYYLDNDPILVQITLTNNTPQSFRFRLAEDRVFSLDFNVRTSSNREVEQADMLIRRRSQSRQVFFREIALETGESFSFVENLRDYASLTQTGAYVVKAVIYPELFQERNAGYSQDRIIESNMLALNLRPRPLAVPGGIPLELDAATNAVLARELMPPDEVVSYILTARQRSQWEKFFLYLDLEAMLARDPLRARQWNAESEEGRQRMLARYRQDLQSNEIEGDLFLIPARFAIERTVYDSWSATVSAMQYFDIGNFTQRKRYVWDLERQNGIWVIVNYTVTNLGTL